MTDLEKVTAQRDLLLQIMKYAHQKIDADPDDSFNVILACSHLHAAITSVEKDMQNAR